MTKRERNKWLSKAWRERHDVFRILDDVAEEEEQSLENWPEGLQETDRYYEAEERSEKISELRDQIDEVRDELENIIGL